MSPGHVNRVSRIYVYPFYFRLLILWRRSWNLRPHESRQHKGRSEEDGKQANQPRRRKRWVKNLYFFLYTYIYISSVKGSDLPHVHKPSPVLYLSIYLFIYLFSVQTLPGTPQSTIYLTIQLIIYLSIFSPRLRHATSAQPSPGLLHLPSIFSILLSSKTIQLSNYPAIYL